MKSESYRSNERITARKVRVISPEGKNLGVKDREEALKIASSYGLDLVEIVSNVNPPVCKIMDFSKFKYEMKKREKERKKKTREKQLKELRIKTKISERDLGIKISRIMEFLTKGNQVRVTISLWKREVFHPERAEEIIDRLKVKMEGFYGNISERREGERIFLTFFPKKR